MFFGTLIGFRGCSVMIRKEILDKNPWPDTLMEDNHLAATIAQQGYRIIFEPNAISYTSEPETLSEVKSQKKRWGEGAYLAFRCHRRFYLKSPQFLFFFMPYFAMGIWTGMLILALITSPILSLGLTSLILMELIWIFVAMYFHTLIFTFIGSGKLSPMRILRFNSLYFGAMTYSYFRGVLLGIKRKKKGGCELHFRHWEPNHENT